MADGSEDRTTEKAGAGADAMALGAAGRAKADAYLDEHTRLARLQSQNLIELNAFELSHLRWRRFNDQMKGAMQIMLVLVGALLVFAVAAAVWSAAHDDGVAIEAFNVPPDMQQRGLTGSVISSLLLDRLTALQAQIDSARAPSSYADKGDDIKVLIPDTGISISDAYRYLVGWLGHQTHISGDVYRNDKGLVLVVRVSGHPGAAFEGGESTLNALTERAAESVYRQTQPFRYGVHLLNNGRYAEADTVLGDLAMNGAASEKPWAYAIWMYTALNRGDLPTAIARAHIAAALDPDNLLAQMNAAQVGAYAGDDERALRYAGAAKAASAAGGGNQIRQAARIAMEHQANATVAEETGDFPAALAQYDTQLAEPDFNGSRWTATYLKAADLAKSHDASASRHALGGYTDAALFALSDVGAGWNQTNLDFPQFQRFAALGDWASAREDMEKTVATPAAQAIEERIVLRRLTLPWLALAQAKVGDSKAAWTEIGTTPLDCYLCLRVRGQIAATQKDWKSADYWFARAAAFAPSIPFAYGEWGAMLMAKGDLDGAVAKFETAHEKGPRFADPLEVWAEVLMAQNRSDLALARFVEANKYAPNWGRLHLKWGEALLWSGDTQDALKQFAVAAGLDLSAAGRSELARVRAGHG
jgi:tetratricopeptide (TPR) repeat protein